MADLHGEDTDSESDTNTSETSSSDRVSLDSFEEQVLHLLPHMFEPDASSDEENGMEDGANADPDEAMRWRLDVDRLAEWCTCSHCQVMPLPRENVCCNEIPEVVAKMEEANPMPECMTDHPGLDPTSLNPWGLQCAWLGYKQQYKGRAFDGPQDAKYRHIAYRQFVRWCWGVLGLNWRVVIPSCVVCCIRAHYPPPGNEDEFEFVGHQYPHLD